LVEACFVPKDMVNLEIVPWVAEKKVHCAVAG
jgi:hypothetical protein